MILVFSCKKKKFETRPVNSSIAIHGLGNSALVHVFFEVNKLVMSVSPQIYTPLDHCSCCTTKSDQYIIYYSNVSSS